VITQCGVTVAISQAKAHETDELRALDGIRRIIRKEIRKELAELFAKIHP
jgi:hypothetical protein